MRKAADRSVESGRCFGRFRHGIASGLVLGTWLFSGNLAAADEVERHASLGFGETVDGLRRQSRVVTTAALTPPVVTTDSDPEAVEAVLGDDLGLAAAADRHAERGERQPVELTGEAALEPPAMPTLPRRASRSPDDLSEEFADSAVLPAGDADAQGRHIEKSLSLVSGPSESMSVSGPRSLVRVAQQLGRQTSKLGFCYQQAAQRYPDLRGGVVLQFAVTAAGRVTDVEVQSSSLMDSAAERCVAATIGRLKFPAIATTAPSIVTYPVLLQAVSQGGAVSLR